MTYDGNGNDSGAVPVDPNSPYSSGSVTVLGNTGSLAKKGYYFNGWNTAADGSGTGYVAGNSFTISSSTKLYAQWAKDTLSSIAVSGSLSKTAYSLSDVWDPSGLTVSATFAHSSADVTADVVWSYSVFATSTSINSVTITASYTWEEVTRTDSVAQNVTVAALESPYTLIPGTNGFADADQTTLVGWTNATLAPVAHLDYVNFEASGAGGCGKYYASDKTWRFYEDNNGEITISVSGARKLSSITFVFTKGSNGTLSDESSNVLTSGTAWEPSSEISSQTFTVGSTSGGKGTIFIKSIAVVYASTTAPSVEINNKISELTHGAIGTFSATTYNPSGATVTWSTSNAEVLSINASTGAYEALKSGVATITATITISAIDYTDSMEIIINGELISIGEAKSICAALDPNTQETTTYTVKVSGFITDLNADDRDPGYERALMLADAKTDGNQLMAFGVYNTNPLRSYAVINGTVKFEGKLQNYNGTYEIKNLTLISYSDDAMTFAKSSYEALNEACEAGTAGVTDEAWNALAEDWTHVDSYSQAKLRTATNEYQYNEDIAHWIDRYDRIVASGKANFMGRTYSSNLINEKTQNNNNTMIIIVVSSIALISAVSVAFVMLCKRKEQ